MPQASVKSAPDRRVRTLERGLDILERVALAQELPFSAVVRGLDLPKSTAHDLLRTLVAKGYLRRDPQSRLYAVGPRLAELAGPGWPVPRILARARDRLHDLKAQTGVQTSVFAQRALGQLVRVDLEAYAEVPLAESPARWLLRGADGQEEPEVALVRRRFADYTSVAVECEPGGPGVRSLFLRLPEADEPSQVLAQLTVPEGRRRDFAYLQSLVHAALGPHPEGRRERPRLGWVMAELDLASYRAVVGWAEHYARRMGVEIAWADGENNELAQRVAAEALLTTGVDVLILHPVNSFYVDELFRAARAKTRGTICFQRPARSAAFDVFVGGDTYRWGRMLARYVIQAGLTGEAVLIEGDPYNDNSLNISRGILDEVATSPALTVVHRQAVPRWSPEEAGRAVEVLLHHGQKVAVVFAGNDNMAQAVCRVLGRLGLLGQVAVVSGDADPETVGRLRRGEQLATVFQDYRELARITLETAVGLLSRGRGAPVPGAERRPVVGGPDAPAVWAVDIPYRVIDRSNADAVDRFWATYREVARPLPEAARGGEERA